MQNKSKLIFLILPAIFFVSTSHAQGKRGNDTAYYVYFPESITARFYFSQKYTSFYLKSKSAKDLHYTPNTTLNMGVGATYHNFSLNLAYGFGFINKDDNKGKTKYLDMQGHFYGPKWTTDFYGQFYKGYHLTPEGFTALPGTDYYYRPDIRVTLAGLSQYRVFNDKRFSYRAALIQNEWQKKSAGTLLAGAEIYYGAVRADSSIVPKAVGNKYLQYGVNKINYFSIGPGIGYAYTLVALKRLFIMGSLTGNLNLSFATEQTENEKANKLSLNIDTRYSIAAGYNSSTWNVSANWIADGLSFSGNKENDRYVFHTGNYRFIIAKKFATGERLRKKLKPVDFIFKE